MLDTDRAERGALSATLRSFGLPYTRLVLAAYRRINEELWAAFRRGRISSSRLAAERFSLLLAQLGATQAASDAVAEIYLTAFARRGDLVPGCRRTLASLEARYRLGIVSNGIDRVQRSRLQVAGLLPRFGTVITSEGCGFAKPDPRIMLKAVAALRIEPAQALYVGDDLHTDGQAAQRAGMSFCWVSPNGRSASGLPRGVRRIPALAQLPALLEAED